MSQKCKSKNKNWRGYGKISGAFYSTIKRNAKRRGIEFSISIKYIANLYEKQKGRCALSNLKLHLPKNSRSDRQATASLDRIDSSKGYIKGNLQWLHKDINQSKWKMPEKRFIFLCKRVAANC